MIKVFHLLFVIALIIIKEIACSDLQSVLSSYYDNVGQFRKEWKKYQPGFDNAVMSALQDNFGASAVNIYEAERYEAHLIAGGFHFGDGVVNVYFFQLLLRELPVLVRPSVKIELSSNHLQFRSKVGRMFIDTTYYVARNTSSVIYARPEDQQNLSPFSLQQVDSYGKVTIIAEDCMLSGISIVTLSGDSVNIGHTPIQLSDCKFTVEISTPNSGAPPVIAPYFPKGPKERFELILGKPIVEELKIKLQGSMYSFINTSVLFGDQLPKYRDKQQKLFASYSKTIKNYVSGLNQETLKSNKGFVSMQDYDVFMDAINEKVRRPCHLALSDLVLYGLETVYVSRTGGPYNDAAPNTAADAIVFSSMQIRGKAAHDDNGTLTSDFAAELSDVTVNIFMTIGKGDIIKVNQITLKGWRSLDFSIIPWETHYKERTGYQALVYGHLLNALPTRVISHLKSVLDVKTTGDGGSNESPDKSTDKSSHKSDENKDDDNKKKGDTSKSDENKHDDNKNKGDTSNENKSSGSKIDNTDTNIDDNKKKDFFTDDLLDKDFFSDDNLDKTFFSDDKIQKDFLTDGNTNENVSKDKTDGIGDADKVDVDAEGSDKENVDSGDANDEKTDLDKGSVDDGDDKITGGDESAESIVDDSEVADADIDKVSDDRDGGQIESDNGRVTKPSGGSGSEFFSNDALDKDFFSDDNFDKDFIKDESVAEKDSSDPNDEDNHVEKDDGDDADDNNKSFSDEVDENQSKSITDKKTNKDFFTDDNLEKGFFTDDNIKDDFIPDKNSKDSISNDKVDENEEKDVGDDDDKGDDANNRNSDVETPADADDDKKNDDDKVNDSQSVDSADKNDSDNGDEKDKHNSQNGDNNQPAIKENGPFLDKNFFSDDKIDDSLFKDDNINKMRRDLANNYNIGHQKKVNLIKDKATKNLRSETIHSRKAKKNVLPLNVHNARRLDNLHMSENEIH